MFLDCPWLLPTYYIRSGEKSYLIRTMPDTATRQDVPIQGATDGQSMKPFSRKAFVKLGKKRKMVLLTVK